jgi:hypothetical protein
MSYELELEQFLILIYELCLTAELAHLSVEIHTRSGERIVGIPTVVTDDTDPNWPDHVDAVSPILAIDAEPIILDQIATCAIFAPMSAVG